MSNRVRLHSLHYHHAALYTIGALVASAWAVAPVVALANIYDGWAVRYALFGYLALTAALFCLRRALHHVHVLEILSANRKKAVANARHQC